MADIARMESALRNAHAAGDTAAAKQIANALKAARDGNQIARRGAILPIAREVDGDLRFDSDAGLLGLAKRAVTGPGRAMRGEMPVRGPDGRLTDEAIQWGAETGLMATPANPMVRSGDRVIPGAVRAMRKPDVPAPTAAALREAADQGYTQLRESGVDYSSASIRQMAETIATELNKRGYTAENAKTTFRTLAKLTDPPDNSVMSVSGLDSARSAFGKIVTPQNPSDQAAAGIVRSFIDEFIERPPAQSVLAGSGDEAARIARDARGNYAAAKRSDALYGADNPSISRTAQLRAAAANSGQNIGNTIRSKLASFLDNPKAHRGFSQEELKQVQGIIEGSLPMNLTRDASNLLGGGGGLGQSFLATLAGAGGYATGGPVGAAAAGAGMVAAGRGSRAHYNRLVMKALAALDRSTRRRSPLYEDLVRKTPALPESAITRSLPMRSGVAVTPSLLQPPPPSRRRLGPNEA